MTEEVGRMQWKRMKDHDGGFERVRQNSRRNNMKKKLGSGDEYLSFEIYIQKVSPMNTPMTTNW